MSTTYLWLAPSPEVLDRVRGLVPKHGNIDWHDTLRNLPLGKLHESPAGQVVVIEFAKFSMEPTTTSDLALQTYTDILDQVLTHGVDPTVVCLGHDLPAAWVANWIRRGVFTYAEADASPDVLVALLQLAELRSQSIYADYQRLRDLDHVLRSLNDTELQVLEMIFEGIPNKSMAVRLQVSQRTIETHRQRLFQKIHSKSLPNFIRKICEWKQLRSQLRAIDDSKLSDLQRALDTVPTEFDETPG